MRQLAKKKSRAVVVFVALWLKCWTAALNWPSSNYSYTVKFTFRVKDFVKIRRHLSTLLWGKWFRINKDVFGIKYPIKLDGLLNKNKQTTNSLYLNFNTDILDLFTKEWIILI